MSPHGLYEEVVIKTISPVFHEAVHVLFIIQLHVQLIVKATATITTEDTEKNMMLKKEIKRLKNDFYNVCTVSDYGPD